MKPGAPGVLIHSRLHGPLSVSVSARQIAPGFSSTSPLRMRGLRATGTELVAPGSRLRGHDEKDVGITR